MILYFSGTGNSLHVAETLKTLLHERTYNMEQTPRDLPSLQDDEPLGIVFPVYAWGLPRFVSEFLRETKAGSRYVWTVMTCGDDMGFADEVLEKVLHRKVDAAFSVQMPNTYVCLPGFDVDTPEVAARKLRETDERLPLIAESIQLKACHSELTRGDAAWLKTYVLGVLFNKFLVTDRHFKTTPDCNACGLCAKHCPLKDIAMTSGRPVWEQQHCTGCLRCYHNCPRHAIRWGRFTDGKGQKGKTHKY